MSEARRVEVAVCERHGLRYNAAEGQGCVRCRSEAGVTAPPRRSAAGPATRNASEEAGASLPMQLLVAALLVAGTGTMFWSAHRQVLASFGSVFGMTAEGPGAATDAMALEDDMGLGEAPDGAEPAAYPPDDTVAVGPAAQEQQMRELMRQMEADARVDAEDARAEAERRQAEHDAGAAEYDDGPDE